MCPLTSEAGLTVSMLVSYSAVLASQNNLVKPCFVFFFNKIIFFISFDTIVERLIAPAEIMP